ncbi:AcrR family transcriptional regulator [Bradyrhizobium sp. LB1.3]
MASAAAKQEPRERFLAEDRKSQIVQTVLHLVNERGVDAVSTQLVADTIGRSQGVVFRHFPTKEALWTSVIEWLRERLETVWAEAREFHDSDKSLKTLERMFLGHIKLIDKYPGLAKLVMSDHLRHQYPSINESFRDLHRRYESQVIALLEEAVRCGIISSTINIPDAATLYFCTIQGLGFQFAIARLRRTQLNADAARLFELLMQAFLASGVAGTRPTSGRPQRASKAQHRH